MKYPDDFKESVHEAFPEGHPVHEALEKGHNIRRYLEGGCKLEMSLEEMDRLMTEGEQGNEAAYGKIHREIAYALHIHDILMRFHEL